MDEIESTKQQICDIGRRLYQKGFAAANEGNLSARLGEDLVLCTPTLFCKGFLQPEDLCTVDLTGNQVAGQRKRTSEILLHLEIYRRRPDLRAIVHCHPPHATAFAIAREPIPLCVLPEAEVFLGEVPIAPYATPGSQAFAETIVPFIDRSKVIVLANHGTVSFDTSIERAYWWTEILDAYCRILLLARQLGSFHYLDPQSARDLLDIKQAWQIDDPRNSEQRSDCEICNFPSFRSAWSAAHVAQRAFPAYDRPDEQQPDVRQADDALVERIAQRVAELLKSR